MLGNIDRGERRAKGDSEAWRWYICMGLSVGLIYLCSLVSREYAQVRNSPVTCFMMS